MPRLAIGPANSAGQGYFWARAAERHLGVHAVSFAYWKPPNPFEGGSSFGFPVDRVLPHHRTTTRAMKRWLAARLLRNTTHLAVDGFASILGAIGVDRVAEELPALRRLVPNLALIAHGSEVRDPDGHLARHPESFFRGCSSEWTDRLRLRSRANRRIAEESGLPIFVSTPDLLVDIPRAAWLPVTVDTEAWSGGCAVLERSVPVVVHVPSRRVPPIKGTEHIEPVLRDLDRQGRIRFVSPERLAHAAMRDLVRSCDIVVDQVGAGFYGVATAEALSAGRLVVTDVGPEVTSALGEDPPIVNVRPSTFAEGIEAVLQNRDEFMRVAAEGPGFARRWHNGVAAAAALRGFVLGGS